jgi:hypothetical protein
MWLLRCAQPRRIFTKLAFVTNRAWGPLMKVHFFGGYRATKQNVLAWCNSLEKKQPNVTAIGWPYPTASPASNPLKCWNCSEAVAKLICVDVSECLIVGHSSGCAIANDVASKTLALGAKNFKLIALDGFLPKPELLNLPGTMVWSAECNGVHSLNYESSKRSDKFHIYKAKVIKKWPLHFSLINVSVSDDHGEITQGYRNCDVNIQVLGI